MRIQEDERLRAHLSLRAWSLQVSEQHFPRANARSAQSESNLRIRIPHLQLGDIFDIFHFQAWPNMSEPDAVCESGPETDSLEPAASLAENEVRNERILKSMAGILRDREARKKATQTRLLANALTIEGAVEIGEPPLPESMDFVAALGIYADDTMSSSYIYMYIPSKTMPPADK